MSNDTFRPNDAPQQRLLLILGNQLFPLNTLPSPDTIRVFMAEDHGLCTYTPHHKLKLVLFLAAMRSYADELRAAGFHVHYVKLDHEPAGNAEPSYEAKLAHFLQANPELTHLSHFEIEDKFFEHRIQTFASARGLTHREVQSPMFLTSRGEFAQYLAAANGKPFMARFYQRQRKRLNILMDSQGNPEGGQWSFDADNRRRLPKDVAIPEMTYAQPTHHVGDVVELVNKRFAHHPGTVEQLSDVWFPTTRKQALAWLHNFLHQRFAQFGHYEDALSSRGDWLFHSVLSPALNLGLLTPQEIIYRALQHAEEHEVPMNSLEGFVRQIIGWREFVRGIYRHYSEIQEQENSFNHHRSMKPCWFNATTGMPPLDDVISKALRLGWTHHIERLMVLSNFMNLCEIQPRQAHDWFMQMHVDSSDWVMGPNVYGMGLRSDGGIFSTKPYVCGSNYLLKMSDYSKGEWCDVADGLYWRFVHRNRGFFQQNPRMAMMTRSLDKLKPERREQIFGKAQRFIDHVTEMA